MAAKSKPYEQFGPYILFKKLETDALGDLWRAGRIENDALGATVALRRLTGGNRDAIVSAVSFARQVVPLLTGPSFVRDQAIDTFNGVPFIAHDYAGGRSLRHIVDRARGGGGAPNPIPIDQALVIVERVALSLSTIGELRFGGERLSHGALLPQFIWISDDGEIRIAGQQLGKGLVGSIKDPKSSLDIARYLSPEYQHTGTVTKASEVYSVGAILYLVVTGLEPPDPMSTSAFAAAIRAAKTMAGAPVPDDIHTIITKSLNLDPNARFASVGDMKQAISALTSGGKYSATSFNLAFYLSNLLKKELEGEAVERDKESKISLAPYLEALAGPASASAGPMTTSAHAEESKSKLPVAAAAVLALVLLGGGAWYFLGSKKAPAAPAPKKLASVVPAPAPKRQEIISEPIVASAATTTGSVTATTGSIDPAAQKKAFEEAVKQKLHEEMMKLQTEYTKQLQQQQSKNAPVPVSEPAPAPAVTRTEVTEEPRAAEPSAAQLDLQRTRDTIRPQETATQQQIPVQTTQAAVQEPPPAPVVPQIHEGDVVDVTQVDVVPKRTRDPRIQYPPMAMRQRVETNILATVLISEKGDVLEVKILRGDDRFGFSDAAMRALRSARYSPAIKDGKRVKTWMPQVIQFKP